MPSIPRKHSCNKGIAFLKIIFKSSTRHHFFQILLGFVMEPKVLQKVLFDLSIMEGFSSTSGLLDFLCFSASLLSCFFIFFGSSGWTPSSCFFSWAGRGFRVCCSVTFCALWACFFFSRLRSFFAIGGWRIWLWISEMSFYSYPPPDF